MDSLIYQVSMSMGIRKGPADPSCSTGGACGGALPPRQRIARPSERREHAATVSDAPVPALRSAQLPAGNSGAHRAPSAMFWNQFSSPSIDTILDRSTGFTLEELLDEDELLQECKAQNSKLTD